VVAHNTPFVWGSFGERHSLCKTFLWETIVNKLITRFGFKQYSVQLTRPNWRMEGATYPHKVIEKVLESLSLLVMEFFLQSLP
jgi:hypothetical protein